MKNKPTEETMLNDSFAQDIASGNVFKIEDLPNLPKPPKYEETMRKITMYLMQHYEPKAEGKQP